MKQIRYKSEAFGTFALYGRYPTHEAAQVALVEFYRRAKEAGAATLMRTMKIV